RLIFFESLPTVEGIGFRECNKLFGDKQLKQLIAKALKTSSNSVVVNLCDAIKDVGYKYATIFGATIGLSDMIVPDSKKELVEAANAKQSEVMDQYHHGQITQEERYNRLIDIWSQANEKLADELMARLKESQNGFNPLYLMADSGARGSRTQIRQLGGMRGLMSKPNGDIIEFPIKSNFKEGLSIIEFFISTNGARKGLSDTALKTAEAGYLTRRLVDISQDVVINEEDCGTINGIVRKAIKDGDEIIQSLADRITGHYTLENVLNPNTGEIIVPIDHEITDEEAKAIEDAGVEGVLVRTVLTCEAKHGVCKKCYGRNLATNKPVCVGEAVGIIAAQSIGQPGTQLTMRTFHVGGTASTSAEASTVSFKHPVFVTNISGNKVERAEDRAQLITGKGYIYYMNVIKEFPGTAKLVPGLEDGSKVTGRTVVCTDGKEEYSTEQKGGIVRVTSDRILVLGSEERVFAKVGSEIKRGYGYVATGEAVTSFDPFSEPIICEYDGMVQFKDLTVGITLVEERNEETGKVSYKVTDHNVENTEPAISIINEEGVEVANYLIPASSVLTIADGELVSKGQVLARLLVGGTKTNDITGGLPRVGELFEARRPRNIATLALVSGEVSIGEASKSKGKRTVNVTDEYGNVYPHTVLLGRHLLVRNGDHIEAGEPLCAGNIDPHDVLAISGENELQKFILDQVQSVYRSAGVDINDKHLGIIVRQMLRKVEILDVGSSKFILGQKVDKYRFNAENARVTREGGRAAIARPCLLGITNASLSIDSFVSAASFQETTKVLTNAAIVGSRDELRGLKENVIIGHLIPAGTGMKCYRDVKLKDEDALELSDRVESVMSERAQSDIADLADMSTEDEEDFIDNEEVYVADEGIDDDSEE
ncbi:MAG: DNA-directed RNA polymerase subunit beta', partial [Sphaerochaetaceae bacterium]|nr:DNA-directed RNA polymerase subunit beta' [Sphaerochaetaceae bacterium]